VGQRSELIPSALSGERVDRVVAMAAGISRKQAADLIDAGAVAVNGSTVTSRSTRLEQGDELVIDGATPAPTLPTADPAVSISVIWEDTDLAVVDKAAGVVVHPGAGNPTGTLVNGLLARYPHIAEVGDPGRPGIVHRLDRDTTGLLIVALSDRSYEALVGALSEHLIERTYLALTWGELDAAGVIDSPIGRSARQRTRMTVTPRGKPARTHYETIGRFHEPAALSLLRCRLETGRTHQIRVHLAAIGHPVVGDGTYGGAREGLDFGRPALHASRLAFAHPITGDRLEFESPTPPDFEALLEGLTKS
jgi:23S rRNA pseudouridine1911/1915/1917 synthase